MTLIERIQTDFLYEIFIRAYQLKSVSSVFYFYRLACS